MMLVYRDTQRRRADLVKEWSDGRLGYAHIRGMNQTSLDEFERDLFAAAVGIPGFAGATHAINWVLGLLLVMHVVTNNGKLVAALRANDDESDAATAEKREQIKAALGKAALERGAEE